MTGRAVRRWRRDHRGSEGDGARVAGNGHLAHHRGGAGTALVLAAAAATVALGLVIATIRGPSAPPSFSARVQEVAAGLRCVACQNLSVADSPSRMAAAMRSRIRAELRSRRTPDQIRAFFVSKYGPWILLSPRASGVGWVVWIAPPLALVLGGGVLLWALLRRARGDASDDGRVTPVERTRIRHDLAALEEPD